MCTIPTTPRGRSSRTFPFMCARRGCGPLAGLMGAGRTELAMSIFGRSYGQKISGTIKINGREVHIKDVKDAINNKLAYVSEDRKNYGLVLIKDIKWNMTLSAMRNFFSKNGVLNENDEILAAEDYKKKININLIPLTRPWALSAATSRRWFLPSGC